MPFDLSGLRIERQDRAGVESVALAAFLVPWPRIAGAPIDRMQFRIERAGDPGRAAAMLPAVARPGFVAGLARTRDRVCAPQMVAGLRIPTVDEIAGAVFGAGYSGDDDA